MHHGFVADRIIGTGRSMDGYYAWSLVTDPNALLRCVSHHCIGSTVQLSEVHPIRSLRVAKYDPKHPRIHWLERDVVLISVRIIYLGSFSL